MSNKYEVLGFYVGFLLVLIPFAFFILRKKVHKQGGMSPKKIALCVLVGLALAAAAVYFTQNRSQNAVPTTIEHDAVLITEADLLNTTWVPEDGSDAGITFLDTKDNDPNHQLYDYQVAADSRNEEIGYWEIKDGEIIPTVTKVLFTPQLMVKMLLKFDGLYVYTQKNGNFKMVKIQP